MLFRSTEELKATSTSVADLIKLSKKSSIEEKQQEQIVPASTEEKENREVIRSLKRKKREAAQRLIELSAKAEEITCNSIANGLCDILYQNPELLDFLYKSLKRD